ncbi:alpha,alpha-trehalase TreF [uncultured Sphingomonas sp.]|uniref:alpha,alpha-trehalase TreF n=1 Tax=uncultured Sphingomonas sp. TaxID=158754 RepID=UPI0025DC3993|nr:alpha,alpha-trehalase TreF [uncultured Sphingomonas sp.]
MTRIARFGAVALLLATAVFAQSTPADEYGDLFRAVQTARIFADGKTFADAEPRRSVAAIMADYRAQAPSDPIALKRFVLANFVVRGEPGTAAPDVRAHVRALWPQLVRMPAQKVAGGSAVPLPRPYVVPGGRFQEIYYWDSYFTMLGLKADGRSDLVEAMIDDFTSLIERYGHIPNGTRTYYLSRSQPPFYALMLDLSDNMDPAVARSRLAALRAEHDFWMKGRICVDRARLACLRVVRMPDGTLLNRYFDDRDTPRDESYAEDAATAREAAPRPAADTQRDLRAGAESGWDFSSRWLRDPRSLASIRTTEIVPVDLNSLLWAMERRIAQRCGDIGDTACVHSFATMARRRKAAIGRYLWQPRLGRYADWSLRDHRPTPVLSAATLYPLFVGLSAPGQVRQVADTVRGQLLASGGLRTTTLRTGQQWDAPNGWAPLQWIAVEGLRRHGQFPLAKEIAARWLTTVTDTYRETGKMLEKYDVEENKPGGGGEYPLQDGFGWTNGVTSALLDRYPDLSRPISPAGHAGAGHDATDRN